MKNLIKEFRMLIAEKLLSWSFDIAPMNEEGRLLQRHISKYFRDKLTKLSQ